MNSRYRRERHQPPYYLLTGLILGLMLGILVSFFILPAQYTNVPPETLSEADKDQYRLMIASAYQVDQNLERAQARLGLLREEGLISILESQASRSDERSDAQTILTLVKALQAPTTINSTIEPTPQITQETVQASATPTPTIGISETPEGSQTPDQAVRTATPQSNETEIETTPFPTATANLSASIPFVLTEQRTVCNASLSESLIQIEVFDEDGSPIPNMEILVSWDGGSSTFFTGYYPEISAGYADFSMNPTTTYLVRVGDVGEVVQNLQAPECEEDDLPFWGSIYLRFDEP